MIQVESLTKLYGNAVAVEDLSFSVQPGEILGLVGPNGAGKTTTLRCMVGILRATRGHVTLNGHDIATNPVEAKRQFAYMPDEPRLFDYLTVREHLQLSARLYQVADGVARGEALLDELELKGRENALPSELSRGMKQKLNIACGLLHSPGILLFDEPLTGLDPMGIRRMKATIVQRAHEGASVIVSSHLLHLLEEIADRILVILNGHKKAHGTREEIRALVPELAADASLEDIFITMATQRSGGPPAGGSNPPSSP